MGIRGLAAGRAGWVPAVVVGLWVAGCTAVAREPESAFVSLPPQDYEFATVWECALEAAEREGFQIASSDRDGDSGRFVTELDVVHRDLIEDTARAHRLRVRVHEGGARGYGVEVAASVFLRREDAEGFSYTGPAEDLLERFRTTLRDSLTRRYRAEEEG